jgi:hypothetical protein
MSTTNTDRDILARTLWGEARGEGLAGEIAVAWTIRNRVFDGNPKSWWGEGYAGGGHEALAIQLLEPERSQLRLLEWRKGDPGRTVRLGEKGCGSGHVRCDPRSYRARDPLLRDHHAEATNLGLEGKADTTSRASRLL